MIIAIDESGSFDCNLDEYSLFCGVIIPTGNKSRFVTLENYYNWESSLPSNVLSSNGEVKGHSLSEEQLAEFVQHVLLKQKDIRIIYSVYDTKWMNDSIVKKHKDFEVLMLDYSVADFEKNNASKKETNYIRSIRDWIKGKNLQQYLKILGLRHIILDALFESMVYFLAAERESEVIESSYLIDKDFISDQNISWQGYFKKILMEDTKKRPLPVIDTWDKQTHPFFKRFPLDGNRIKLSPLLKDDLSFEDSAFNFEIRLADICGIIINRFYNRRMYTHIFKILESIILPYSEEPKIIKLRDFDLKNKIKEMGLR